MADHTFLTTWVIDVPYTVELEVVRGGEGLARRLGTRLLTQSSG